MKRKLFNSMLAASAVAMICACGDDAKSTAANDLPNSELSSSSVGSQNPVLSSSSVNAQNPASSESEIPINRDLVNL